MTDKFKRFINNELKTPVFRELNRFPDDQICNTV